MSVEDVQRALAAAVHENNELRAALNRVRNVAQCSSGRVIGKRGESAVRLEALLDALGEAKSNVRLENRL